MSLLVRVRSVRSGTVWRNFSTTTSSKHSNRVASCVSLHRSIPGSANAGDQGAAEQSVQTERADWMFVFACAIHNLVRLRNLQQVDHMTSVWVWCSRPSPLRNSRASRSAVDWWVPLRPFLSAAASKDPLSAAASMCAKNGEVCHMIAVDRNRKTP
jgi:hypothetical protein